MQINGNYNSYPNYNYSSRTPYGAEGLQDEQALKKEDGGSAGSGVIYEHSSQQSQAAVYQSTANRSAEILTENKTEEKAGLWKKGTGLLKGFWEELGQEDAQETQPLEAESGDETLEEKETSNGINAVVSAIKQGFSQHIIDRWEAVKEKIKVAINSALKRFGKGDDTFSALTDPGSGSLFGGRAGNQAKKQQEKEIAGVKISRSEGAAAEENHLMDSYSKSGQYCKINENLTYQYGRAPYKVADKNSKEKQDSGS